MPHAVWVNIIKISSKIIQQNQKKNNIWIKMKNLILFNNKKMI